MSSYFGTVIGLFLALNLAVTALISRSPQPLSIVDNATRLTGSVEDDGLQVIGDCVDYWNSSWVHVGIKGSGGTGCRLAWRTDGCGLYAVFSRLELSEGSAFVVQGVAFRGKDNASRPIRARLPLTGGPVVTAYLEGDAEEVDLSLESEDCEDETSSTGDRDKVDCGETSDLSTFRTEYNASSSADCRVTVKRNSSRVCRLVLRTSIGGDCSRGWVLAEEEEEKICGGWKSLEMNGETLELRLGGSEAFELLANQEECRSAPVQLHALRNRCARLIRDNNFIIRYEPETACDYTVMKNSSSVCGLMVRTADRNVGCEEGYAETEDGVRICQQWQRLQFKGETIGLRLRGSKGSWVLEGRQVGCSVENRADLVDWRTRSCCGDEGTLYRGRAFTLFAPAGLWDCQFRIARYSPTTCRLRLILDYFWVGRGSEGECLGGMEVDGYIWCGCQTGLVWTTSELVWGLGPRRDEAIIKLAEDWLQPERGPRRGFVIRVQQLEGEQCSRPFMNSKRSLKKRSLDLRDDVCLAQPPPPSCSREPPWVPTQRPWVPTQRPWDQQDPCQVVTSQEGVISSPGYPRPNPAQRVHCFSFSEDDCGTDLYFEDFDVDLDTDDQCSDGYLILGTEGRYCGTSLARTKKRLPKGGKLQLYTGRNNERSGRLGSGRGFLAKHRRVDCREYNADEEEEEEEGYPCGSSYKRPRFRIRGAPPPGGSRRCTYTVFKSSPDVCGLELQVEDVDLRCGRETLFINGKYYCGRLATETVQLRFPRGDTITVEYRKLTTGSPLEGDTGAGRGGSGRFTITGRQITECDRTIGIETLKVAADERSTTGAEDCLSNVVSPSGVLKSASAPHPRLACTYSFQQLPGMCFLRLDFGSVKIPWSETCSSDYLELNDSKHCGTSLSNTTKVFDFSERNGTVEVPYVLTASAQNDETEATAFWTIGYRQLPCHS